MRGWGIAITAAVLASACVPPLMQPGSPDRWSCVTGESARVPVEELKAAVEGGDWIGQVHLPSHPSGYADDLKSATLSVSSDRIGLAWITGRRDAEAQRVTFSIDHEAKSFAGYAVVSVCRNQHGETEVNPSRTEGVFLRFSPRGGYFNLTLRDPQPGAKPSHYTLRRQRCDPFCSNPWIDQKPDLVF